MSQSRLRKLLIVYLLLLVPIGWLAMKYQPFLLDGDAVSYMDIADLLHAHRWAGAVNGYWHPLYPAVLASAQIVFHPTRWNEIPAYYFANYAIFLLELVAMVAFVYALDRLRARTLSDSAPPLLSREALALLGSALIVIASQRELAIGPRSPGCSASGADAARLRDASECARDRKPDLRAADGSLLRPRVSHKVLRIRRSAALDRA